MSILASNSRDEFHTGRPLSETMKEARNDSYALGVVIRAYQGVRLSTHENMKRDFESFRDKEFLRCMKNYRRETK